ncbi:PAAR domain-containing protein [Pseudomonas cerasi]
MQNAARVGDVVCHGGVIVSGSCNTTTNSCCSAMVGVSVAICALHAAAPVVCGSCTVFINRCNAARLGDIYWMCFGDSQWFMQCLYWGINGALTDDLAR